MHWYEVCLEGDCRTLQSPTRKRALILFLGFHWGRRFPNQRVIPPLRYEPMNRGLGWWKRTMEAATVRWPDGSSAVLTIRPTKRPQSEPTPTDEQTSFTQE